MKGLQGMIVAAGLGIIGAVCNWFYISQQARDYEKIQFLAVKPQTQIAIGEVFKTEHFMAISIPKAHLGNLDKLAIKWESRSAVIGDKAKKTYTGDELIIQEDLKTTGFKRPNENLGKGEVAISISLNSSTFVASRVNPGDSIGFVVSGNLSAMKNKGEMSGADSNTGKGSLTMIGPFRLLMLGDRTGSTEIYRATQGNAKNENVITLAVKAQDGKFEPKAEQIINLNNGISGQILQVVLYPKDQSS